MPVFEYEGAYIAQLRHFVGSSGLMDIYLAARRDGVHFSIPSRTPIIPTGGKGAWDGGMALSTNRPLELNGKLCAYYGGTLNDHKTPDATNSSAIGRAWLRKDGFASLSGGVAVTKPIIIERLHINARGKVVINVNNAKTVFQGDSTDAVIACPSSNSVPVKVEFDLAEGELFSFWSE